MVPTPMEMDTSRLLNEMLMVMERPITATTMMIMMGYMTIMTPTKGGHGSTDNFKLLLCFSVLFFSTVAVATGFNDYKSYPCEYVTSYDVEAKTAIVWGVGECFFNIEKKLFRFSGVYGQESSEKYSVLEERFDLSEVRRDGKKIEFEGTDKLENKCTGKIRSHTDYEVVCWKSGKPLYRFAPLKSDSAKKIKAKFPHLRYES